MVKAHTSVTENPLDAAMSFVAQRKSAEPTPLPPAAAETPTPAAAPVAQQASAPSVTEAEQPTDDQLDTSQQQKGKKDSIPATDTADYVGLFLKPVRGRKAKTIYISENMHRALATITQACPDNIGLSDLLINIVTHHFETFGPGIRQFLTAQDKLRKSKLPY